MSAERWKNELSLAKREDKKWIARGKRIVKRYRDERDGVNDIMGRYNILWSNIQTMLPALYGRTPKAQVERRWKDQDPVGRTAAVILERVIQYEIDHYGDFDNSAKQAVMDRLLPGRGVTWVRFEEQPTTLASGEPGPTLPRTCVDYVFWEDFRVSPARCWDEVTWVGRRTYMTKEEGIQTFGEQFKDVPLQHEPIGLDEMRNQVSQGTLDSMKKAKVWEIWSKPDKTVIFVAEGYDKVLKEVPDPLGLDGFWPCPKPLYSSQTTDTIVPVPDFVMYQDQAKELDELTNRIGMLVQAVKVVGVYDSSQTGIQRMLNEGVNNTLIPVDTWAAFAEKGGIKGTVEFLPLDMVVGALNECYLARENTKQVIYDITGLSDIVRGASNASETATAQQIKSNYASLRLKRMQTEVAQFTSEIMRIKGQIIADTYPAEMLIEMSGVNGTLDAQYAPQAVQLLKTEPIRSFRIEVASDSLVEMDEQAEKEGRVEFLTAVGQFMERSLPVVQQVPDMGPLVGQMILFATRAFKGSRPIEAAFEEAMAKLQNPTPKPQPPDPEQIKAQAQMQIEQMKEQGANQRDAVNLQAQGRLEQLKAAAAHQSAELDAQVERERMAHEQQMESIRQQAESERAKYKADLDAQVKLQIAEMTANATREAAQLSAETSKETEAMKGEASKEVAREAKKPDESLASAVSELAKEVKEIKTNQTAPRKIRRGKDGKVDGVEINGTLIPVTR